ncbi:unnamed protein product [Didymodactylos carnosus]|uniref:peptidylamidoglycolate lyase n=1 Tax=Didymodactylos carnosus TaxID=1234261 RepID=A0A8S2EMC4_9BILA|nr:unnamed protein product [Didymodactylos carnosus]CAF3996332.1 unnamed protein product [Didymodactylos carnosus]
MFPYAGFSVGKNTPYKYIVLNIHYLTVLQNDKSGNQLLMSRKKRKYQAGVLLSGTSQIYLKPKSHTVRSHFSCRYSGPPISIFAARVHAHQWARVNSLYRVRSGEISQVVKGDPQWPQSFYQLPSPVEIVEDDYLVGQCVYDNDGDRIIRVGSTHNDEMCNVYAMYSYEPNAQQKPLHTCWDNQFGALISLIPTDADVPPRTPLEINSNHHHAEHTMGDRSQASNDWWLTSNGGNYRSAANSKYNNKAALTNKDYEDYMQEVETQRSRDKLTPKSSSGNQFDNMIEFNKILTHLGISPAEYEYDTNYDDLLPTSPHLNEKQIVKLHSANKISNNLYKCIDTWPDSKSVPRLGQIGGIALGFNDDLVVFHRGERKWESRYFSDESHFRNDAYGPIDEDVLVHVDTKTGRVKQKWGAKMFYMPHGLTIDHDGNFWLTDIAMHQNSHIPMPFQVFMYSANDKSRPALIVGEKFQSGSGPTQLCRPADVAVMKNGDFFVADGYCNSRIVKFNKKGEYLTEWGNAMDGIRDVDGFPLPNQWNIVHSLALNEEQKLLCGADRENYRIQCFDLQGQFQRQIRVEQKNNIGPIYAIEFAPATNGTVLYAVTGGQTQTKKVYLINPRDGEILTSFDSNPHLVSPHDIAVSTNGREVYVGELTDGKNGLHKFELVKQKDLTQSTSPRKSYVSDKNFRISLIIMGFFAVPVLIAVVVGFIIRTRNMRKLHRLNTFLSDVKNTSRQGGNSVLGDWMNRRKGFERLDQYSDGENEPLDQNSDEQEDGHENSSTLPNGNGTATTTTTTVSDIAQHNTSFNNVAFKMGGSL